MREAIAVADAEKRDQELSWAQTREVIAALINVNKGKKGKQVKGQDIIKLDMDREQQKERAKESLERLRYWQKIKENGGLIG